LERSSFGIDYIGSTVPGRLAGKRIAIFGPGRAFNLALVPKGQTSYFTTSTPEPEQGKSEVPNFLDLTRQFHPKPLPLDLVLPTQ
jgi:hypothetical protein